MPQCTSSHSILSIFLGGRLQQFPELGEDVDPGSCYLQHTQRPVESPEARVPPSFTVGDDSWGPGAVTDRGPQ